MRRFTFTLSQFIIVFLLFISIGIGFLISQINYNHNVAQDTQNRTNLLINSTHKLLDLQGNLSQNQRQQLLNEFLNIERHGGFATGENQMKIQTLLSQINQSLNELKLNSSSISKQ